MTNNWLIQNNEQAVRQCKYLPRTGSNPDLEIKPKANAATSAASAQQMIGWKIFFTPAGKLTTEEK